MPGRDRSGPEGLGSMTGRRMGPCNGTNTTFARRGLGRGYGRGLARGYGRGFAYSNTKEDLQREKEELQKRIDQIENELK